MRLLDVVSKDFNNVVKDNFELPVDVELYSDIEEGESLIMNINGQVVRTSIIEDKFINGNIIKVTTRNTDYLFER